MTIELKERCRCGAGLSLFEHAGKWNVTCLERCYDPSAEDGEPIESLYGRGETPEDALADYMRTREEADLEPVYALSSLATFVVPSHPGMRLYVESAPACMVTLAVAEAYARANVCAPRPLPIYYVPEEATSADIKTLAGYAANDITLTPKASNQ